MSILPSDKKKLLVKNDDDLQLLRKKIDSVDAKLLPLLNERAQYSIEVGKLKAEAGACVFRPEREKNLMEKLLSANKGSLPNDHLYSIYREIISSSRALQRESRVAYLGPEGTFSNIASHEYFGHSFKHMAKKSLDEVFHAVESAECEYGVVPFENSLYGTIIQSFDLFNRHTVAIQAEWISRIHLSLLSCENSLASIRAVYSHSQPLGQCATWLKENLPNAQQISLESTAAAAYRVAKEPKSAAIGHIGLAQQLSLHTLAENIEDTPDNWTRFFVISHSPSNNANANKSSILFSLADNPGSLSNFLQALTKSKINISKLESRPMRGECWKYTFFADLDCDITLDKYAPLLKKLSEQHLQLRILGAYSAATQAQACN